MTDREKVIILQQALLQVIWEHRVVEEDSFYNCPKTGGRTPVGGTEDWDCDCGADYHNKIIGQALKETGYTMDDYLEGDERL